MMGRKQRVSLITGGPTNGVQDIIHQPSNQYRRENDQMHSSDFSRGVANFLFDIKNGIFGNDVWYHADGTRMKHGEWRKLNELGVAEGERGMVNSVEFGSFIRVGWLNFEISNDALLTTFPTSKSSSLSRPKASRVFLGAKRQKTEQTPGVSRTNYSEPPEEGFVKCSTEEFAYLLLKSGLPRRPSWLKGPFSYKQKMLDWQVNTARPVFYELDSTVATAYRKLLNAGALLASCPYKREDLGQQALYGQESTKGMSGSSYQIYSKPLNVSISSPQRASLNFTPITFYVENSTISFFPDMILIVKNIVNATILGLQQARVEVIERSTYLDYVPTNAEVIGHSFTYVNKDGGPDMRYSYNPQTFLIRNWDLDIHFKSDPPLHTSFSDRIAVESFAMALNQLIQICKEST